jgi:uncharacterized protein HemY
MALNDLAWDLATATDQAPPNSAIAAKLAERAVELAPQNGNFWNTLGVAHYRVGEFEKAVADLERSISLRSGGDSSDFLFLAMAHQRLGDTSTARKWYDGAVQRMQSEKSAMLSRFQREAAQLLGVDEPPAGPPTTASRLRSVE